MTAAVSLIGRCCQGSRSWIVYVKASLWCGSRFFTQSGAVVLARCRHGSEREGEPRLWSRSKGAAVICGFILNPRPHVQRRWSLVGAVAVTSCRRLQPRSGEVSVLDPPAVQD